MEKIKLDTSSLQENHKEFIKYSNISLKSQQRLRSGKHNTHTEEVNKTALSASDDKRIQLIDLLQTYAYRTNEELLCKKEELTCINIIKVINYNDVTKEKIKDHNTNWS